LLNETFSDCQLFPDMLISQGSVAMRLRCDGFFNDCSMTSSVKEFWNWSTFGDVMGNKQ